jgi:hypothetical protein
MLGEASGLAHSDPRRSVLSNAADSEYAGYEAH